MGVLIKTHVLHVGLADKARERRDVCRCEELLYVRTHMHTCIRGLGQCKHGERPTEIAKQKE